MCKLVSFVINLIYYCLAIYNSQTLSWEDITWWVISNDDHIYVIYFYGSPVHFSTIH